ncbi:putative gustatory receptor 28a [Photinus pyralis]|uniref:putative gustatory receptor 28a n=1 Tax=Photinus pyralis TaxID=7054 RepID=UPI0012675139|nr:putative gustatory receptor 28a [Photinus pyralis]
MCAKFLVPLLNHVKSDVNDVYEVLHPLQALCQVVGLAPYSFTRRSDGSKTYIRSPLSIIGYAILFALYISAIVVRICFKEDLSDEAIERYLDNLQEYVIALIVFVAITFGWIFSRKVIEVFKNVDEIDKEFKDLSVWMPYRRCYGVLILNIALIIVVQFIVFIWIWLRREMDEDVLLTLLNLVIILPFLLLTHLTELQYVQYIHLLKYRYAILNEHLEVLYREHKTREGWILTTNSDPDVTKGILKSAETISNPISVVEKVVTIHLKLSDAANLINTSFSVQLLFRITIAFTSIVAALYTIGVNFSSTEDEQETLDVDVQFTAWAASSAFELFLIVWIASSTCEEANKCPRLMHKIRNATKNSQLQDTIEMYSLQMYHNRLQLYVCGLFPLDYTLLHTIVAGVTTYLVILIQFRSAGMASKKRLQCNRTGSIQ